MKSMMSFSCMLLISSCLMSFAAQPPAKSWSKVFSSRPVFAAAKGDSVIVITDRITVFSLAGQVITEGYIAGDLQNLSSGKYSFAWLKDNTILLLKDKYIVKKLSLAGDLLWTKNLRDTVPNIVCNDFFEGDDGSLSFCGDVSYQTAYLTKISNSGKVTFCNKYESFGSFNAMTTGGNTLYLSSSRPSVYQPSQLVSFDSNGNLIKTISEACNATVLVFNDNHIISLGIMDGGALFKRSFFATRDIILKKFDTNGNLTNSMQFDFGKYETPVDFIRTNDGFIMVSISDETVNMGTNILNYFVTKINSALQKDWQLRFGTDSSSYNGSNNHYRSYNADEQGRVLAVHNDTLTFYADPKTYIQKNYSRSVSNTSTGNTRKYDLSGRMLQNTESILQSHIVEIFAEKKGYMAKKSVLLKE